MIYLNVDRALNANMQQLNMASDVTLYLKRPLVPYTMYCVCEQQMLWRDCAYSAETVYWRMRRLASAFIIGLFAEYPFEMGCLKYAFQNPYGPEWEAAFRSFNMPISFVSILVIPWPLSASLIISFSAFYLLCVRFLITYFSHF